MPRKSPFAERLQRLMTEKEMSQSDLAREIWGEFVDERGYTVAKNRQVLGKYLKGTVSPRMSTLRRIADVLEVPISDLDPGSDPLSRPGSGIYVEEVDRLNARIELNLVAPKTLIREVVALLGRHTT